MDNEIDWSKLYKDSEDRRKAARARRQKWSRANQSQKGETDGTIVESSGTEACDDKKKEAIDWATKFRNSVQRRQEGEAERQQQNRQTGVSRTRGLINSVARRQDSEDEEQ